MITIHHRQKPLAVVEPEPLEQLSTEQLIEIVRSTSSDPASLTLRERMAWRELALRGSRRPSN